MIMNVVLGTVVYPAALKYLDEFLKSVNEQTVDGFKTIVIADGLDDEAKTRIASSSDSDLLIEDCVAGSKPFENRIRLLEAAKRAGADLLVLSDADDVLAENRMEKTISAFEPNCAFFYNDLRIKKGELFFPCLPKRISYTDLIDKNFLGFTNTAINMKMLSVEFLKTLYSGETDIFDWYLFSRIAQEVGGGKYIDDTYSEYRLHDNNLAGSMDSVGLERELEVKIEHYRLLSDANEAFREEYERVKSISLREEDLEAESEALTPHRGYWWDRI